MDVLEYRDFVGKEIAVKAAQNFRKLRASGVTIRKTIDVIIATFCIENNFSLIQNDRDFDPMEQYLGRSMKRAAQQLNPDARGGGEKESRT
jgi:predicted nucleic acid-binding protein